MRDLPRSWRAHRHSLARSPSGSRLTQSPGGCLPQAKICANSLWYIACTPWWEFPRRSCEMHQTDAATSGAPTSDPAICKSRWFSSTQLRGPVLNCGHRRKRWGTEWQAATSLNRGESQKSNETWGRLLMDARLAEATTRASRNPSRPSDQRTRESEDVLTPEPTPVPRSALH